MGEKKKQPWWFSAAGVFPWLPPAATSLIAAKTRGDRLHHGQWKKRFSDTVREVAGLAPMSSFTGWLMVTWKGKSLPGLKLITCAVERQNKKKKKEKITQWMFCLIFLLFCSLVFLPSVRWFVNRHLIPASTEKTTHCQVQVCLVFHLLTSTRS